ncbi:hypothetical protein EMIHUDRAFT_240419 [Emiliania huxleyi CCMP1516]|uniref:glutamine--tRNA ligase n=2 Tax=Emiliania huxleyi TaxID=2903 RepID=A0A0D3JFV7_EMIH1|nr:hypothetical protein EMIHUDRAFT_240419 [Emiliania huxleyi CCMP1516]EOD22392.1 hypothetical protein EMIHUDRAFT_240419 [Emiliania huxleyi CCMP1516]|eukprot:XP_005774821.1 hypothetical protein EMIHUDRAFT_240419 [Emiliania huxleyi CCMP1516]
MSKSGAKTAKTDAVKASRKRPDPEGLRLIEEGEKAFEAKDFVAATERFVAAKAACDASTVQATAKPKKEKPPPAEKEAVADKEPKPADGGVEQKLVLKPPVENIQAKPLRPDIDAAHNYALNAAEDHAAYLKRTGGATVMRFDDTNPAAEKQEYIDSILDSVAWLGHTPVAVELRGLAAGGKPFESPNHPRNAEMGARRLVLPETIYIDRDDFREARASVALPRTPRCAQRPAAVSWRQRTRVGVGRADATAPSQVDAPSFFGLAPGKEVGLLGAGVTIRCDEVVRGGDGGVTALVCSADGSAERNKTKGHLHWVSAAEGVRAKVRVYGAPSWLKLLNPDSCVEHEAVVERDLAQAAGPPARSADRPAFQFQRLGFFCVDTDSTAEAPVFNRIVPLKEDKEKKAG